jgi:hypothetical protein
MQTRPARRVVPTSKLTDANNLEKPELSFQRKAVHEFHTRQVQEARPLPELPGGASTDALPVNGGANSDGVEGSHKTPGMSVCIANVMICYSITSFAVTNECHTIPSDEELDDHDVPMPGMRAVFSQNS